MPLSPLQSCEIQLVESGYLKITCFTTKSPCSFVPVFSTNHSQYIINLNQAVMSYSNTCPKVTLRQRPGANGRISLYLDCSPASPD